MNLQAVVNPMVHPKDNQYKNERIKLAAAFRMAAMENMHEAVANHFSLRVNDDEFLINPRRHFALMRASDLELISIKDWRQNGFKHIAPKVDKTAIGLHAPIHAALPHARCVMHIHSFYATALGCLEDSMLYPIDQNAATYYGRVVVDKHYGGLALDEEGARCSSALTDPTKCILLLGNHGFLVVAETVEECWNHVYYFERAAKNLMLAYQTGKPLRFLDEKVAGLVARQAVAPDFYQLFFESMLELLDRQATDYKN